MTPASEWRAPCRSPLPPVFTVFWIPNCQVTRVLWHKLHDVVPSHGTPEGQLQLPLLTRSKGDGAWDPGERPYGIPRAGIPMTPHLLAVSSVHRKDLQSLWRNW